MRMLYLDDDTYAIRIFTDKLKAIYRTTLDIVSVNNLVAFDDLLYNSDMEYDGIVMDLGLPAPVDFPEEAYEKWLNEMGMPAPTLLKRGIPVIGWDYYNAVMRKRERTKDRLDTVLLKTGYADLLVAEFGPDCCAPATLLNKGDEHYDEVIQNYMQKLENKRYKG